MQTRTQKLKPEIIKELENADIKARTAKKISNISYRQINDWDKKGLLPHQKRGAIEDWRRFTVGDVIILTIYSLLRTQGISVPKLKRLYDWTNQEKWLSSLFRNIFVFRSEMYLCTDLEENFLILPFEDLEDNMITLSDKPITVLWLNPIIKTLCEEKVISAPYPQTAIERKRNDWKNIFKRIKRRAETKPYQKMMLTIRSSKVVNVKDITDENLDT